MKRTAFFAALLTPMLALAQAGAPTIPPATATTTATAPIAPAAVSVEAVSALCKPKNIRGIRKMVRVNEAKPGVESENFRKNPHQYFWFRQKDSLFAQYSGTQQYRRRTELLSLLQEAAKRDVSQYVLTDKGLLYLYKKGVAVDSFRCRVVQQATEGYKKGDVLLSPAQPSLPQFTRVLAHPKLAGKPKAKDAGMQQNKKKRKKAATPVATNPVGQVTTTPATAR